MDFLFGVLLVASHVVSTAAFACSSYGTTMYDTKCQQHVNGQRCDYGHPYWYNPVCDYDGCNNRPCDGNCAHNCCNGTWLSSCRTPYHGNVNIVNGGSQCVYTDPYGDSYECPEPAACVAGTYSEDGKNAGGDKACQQCPPGKYQSAAEQTECINCEAGTYSAATASTVCFNCEAGQYKATAGVNIACDECEAGKYKATAGVNTACDNCEAGQYKATAGVNIACDECEAGTYSEAGASVCTDGNALGTCGSALYDFFSGLERRYLFCACACECANHRCMCK
jgi:hypothetical protein